MGQYDFVLENLKKSHLYDIQCHYCSLFGSALVTNHRALFQMAQKVIQEISIRLFPGLENFVPAVAYHLCLKLHPVFLQPGNGLL